MKRRNFFGNLLGVIAGGVLAPRLVEPDAPIVTSGLSQTMGVPVGTTITTTAYTGTATTRWVTITNNIGTPTILVTP